MLPAGAVAVRVGGAGARGRRAGGRARVAWGLMFAALAAAGLLGLAALSAGAPDAEGRRRLQFGPAAIIIPAVYPVANAALGQTF